MRDFMPALYQFVSWDYLSLEHFETKKAVKKTIFFVDFINIVACLKS